MRIGGFDQMAPNSTSCGTSSGAAVRRFAERAGDRIQADPHDFLPSLVRLQQTPPSPLGRRVLLAALVFLGGVLLWATFGELDIIAVADGKLVPDTYVKIVQPTDSGVVKEILVKEGEEVRAGQVLMRMDAALSEAELKELRADYRNKHLALRRIDAELSGVRRARWRHAHQEPQRDRCG